MKNLEALTEQIVKQRKIDGLIKLKRQKIQELKDIDYTLRKLILKK